MARHDADAVDRILEQWAQVRPGFDMSPVGVVGRVSRLSRLIDKRLGQNFGEHGLQDWMYDVLATLRRSGAPYELTAGDLVAQTMVTTGAMTNRIDRLEALGFVERRAGGDRRTVIVALTDAGRKKVDAVSTSHLATERELLGALTDKQQAQLAALLRTVLLDLGDTPPA
ncbi:MarR family winged helix-turn-helix transcriptional regulator [Aquihabitans daechungensis]|uniref:MarR family winged helix-turn-helix transcriptional regulator n=1 Tax=Aquihabitans daechungensis TaxID=1052257 RepID=UPI003B9DC749